MSGEAAFANALADGLTGTALWSGLVPFVGIIITATIFAFVYRSVRRTDKGFAKGKANF